MIFLAGFLSRFLHVLNTYKSEAKHPVSATFSSGHSRINFMFHVTQLSRDLEGVITWQNEVTLVWITNSISTGELWKNNRSFRLKFRGKKFLKKFLQTMFWRFFSNFQIHDLTKFSWWIFLKSSINTGNRNVWNLRKQFLGTSLARFLENFPWHKIFTNL